MNASAPLESERRGYAPGDPSPNKDEHASVSNYRHAPCDHCGRAGHAHDRVRVYPDDGPAGSYHYRYVCPDGGSA